LETVDESAATEGQTIIAAACEQPTPVGFTQVERQQKE
jgi:hypothetical protein